MELVIMAISSFMTIWVLLMGSPNHWSWFERWGSKFGPIVGIIIFLMVMVEEIDEEIDEEVEEVA